MSERAQEMRRRQIVKEWDDEQLLHELQRPAEDRDVNNWLNLHHEILIRIFTKVQP